MSFEIIPLNPVHFFGMSVDCHFVKGKKGMTLPKDYLLPNLSRFHGDLNFAEVALGWNQEGIFGSVFVSGSFEIALYPDYLAGDAVEIFIDTRDRKTAGFPTRFCHHFFFLPAPVQTEDGDVVAAEVTHFRTDDRHELADAAKLYVATEKVKKQTVLNFFIPAECLHGYDPKEFDRLGFNYCISKKKRDSAQFFSASGEDFTIEQHPFLWASLKLVKEST